MNFGVKTIKSGYINASSCNAAGTVKIEGTSLYYTSIQSSFSGIVAAETVQTQGIDFAEDLNPIQDISFKLSGGYSCDYLLNPGFTTVNGTLTIKLGTMTIDNLIIQ